MTAPPSIRARRVASVALFVAVLAFLAAVLGVGGFRRLALFSPVSP
jgi:hypothetical protein